MFITWHTINFPHISGKETYSNFIGSCDTQGWEVKEGTELTKGVTFQELYLLYLLCDCKCVCDKNRKEISFLS